MGLFSWLFGKPGRVAVRDVVWLKDSARAQGAARAVTKPLAAGRHVLLLAHFPATLAAFGEHPVGRECTRALIPDALTPAAALKFTTEPAARVHFGLARNLRPDEFPPEDAPESPLAVVVLERHPLRRHDEHVVRFAEGLGSRAEVEFHVSLDDPLMRLFDGERLQGMLRQLGMEEDVPIKSAMVARRVKAAQGKLAAQVSATERDAESAEEWLRLNLSG
jgi:hypothetical protein